MKIKSCRMVALRAEDFKIEMVDRPKTECGESANAGFFGFFSPFTLPVAHLICDFKATDERTRKYCIERGRFEGEKFFFDSSKWSYTNGFCGKAVSTIVSDGRQAAVVDCVELPEGRYAVSGVPVLRDGKDCKWGAYVTKQGWSSGTVRAEWHTFVGIKDDPGTVYVAVMETTSSNMVKKSEAYKYFKALGFRDVLKLDGGGSVWFRKGGKTTTSGGARRINNVIPMHKGVEICPYIRPVKTVKRWSLDRQGVAWVQWHLNRHGFDCAIDGSFGAKTLERVKEFQRSRGLEDDGKCGPLTRAALED